MIDYPEQIHSDYLELIANNLAHELKTSLVAVKSGIKGVKNHIPALVIAYQEAVKHQLNVPDIQTRHIKILANALELAERAAHCASSYVNMFSINMSKVNPEKMFFENCSIFECVQLAASQYPYRSDEQKFLLVDAVQVKQDFLFSGNKILVINLIINILRNTIYNIQDVGSGQITIWTKPCPEKNHLFIKDSSKAIGSLELEMIFTPFNQLHRHDLGMGLFFCKQLMQALNGDIVCRLDNNQFIEFDITFPAVSINK